MATEIRMPKLGMTMTDGKIVEWLKAEGDSVAMDEPIFIVANDKVNIDVESQAEGVLLKIVAEEGDVIPVGDVVAYIGQAGEEIAEGGAEKAPEPEAQEAEAKAEAEQTKEVESTPRDGSLRATPAARALAKKLGVDINAVNEYCGGKRIKKADVEEYDEKKDELAAAGKGTAVLAPPYEDIKPTNMKQIVAEKMVANFQEAPHFYLGMNVDATRMNGMLANARAKAKEGDPRPTFTDVMTWIIARVIKEHPMINSQWNDGMIRQFRDVNFGIAADTPDGLIVPVVHGADQMSFNEIVRERSRLITAAREGKLSMDDMYGGTFTLSNLGMFGIDNFHGILNSPECALLTVGAVQNEPFVEDGELKTRPVLKFSLSCDHRVLDGATGARFLKRMKEVMEAPERLLDKDLF